MRHAKLGLRSLELYGTQTGIESLQLTHPNVPDALCLPWDKFVLTSPRLAP